MRNLLSTVLLLAATLAASAQNDLKSVLSQLDATLSHRDSYIAGREQRIESLKNILRKSDFSDAQRYTLNQQLIDEYTPYQADSTTTSCQMRSLTNNWKNWAGRPATW